jgi:hypothetical protein
VRATMSNPSPSPAVRNDDDNRNALESYFSDVEKVSEKLATKLWEILEMVCRQRHLVSARSVWGSRPSAALHAPNDIPTILFRCC